MNEKSQTGTLFVKAASTESCPECTWFVRMYGDPAADVSDATVTTTTTQGPSPKKIVEIRPMGMSAADPGEGQLFMPAKDQLAQPEGTWFVRVKTKDAPALDPATGVRFGAGAASARSAEASAEWESSQTAKVSKVQSAQGAVTQEISLE
jgi:hypothetical protein